MCHSENKILRHPSVEEYVRDRNPHDFLTSLGVIFFVFLSLVQVILVIRGADWLWPIKISVLVIWLGERLSTWVYLMNRFENHGHRGPRYRLWLIVWLVYSLAITALVWTLVCSF